jgi:iron complex outermembrane recepter protein
MVKKATRGLQSRAGLLRSVSAAAVIGLGIFGSAFAQQAPAELTGSLEEIVVTATKRSTTLQDTPISMSAVSGEELLNQGIGDFTALAQEIPGISMRSNGPGQTEYEMRGIASGGGRSPTVGFYLDDVPMSPPATGFVGKTVVDPNSYDLNRVEVLRGPQGTLYGAGSMGGTIRLITNQPDSTGFHASAETILSDTDGGGFNHTENGMVNLPLITDQLAIRIVGTEAHSSGWIDRIVVNPFPLATNGGLTRGDVLAAPVQADFKDVNSTEEQGGRVSVLYTPTDRLTVGATVFYQHISQDGANSFDSPPDTLAHYQPFNIPEPYDDRFTMWSLNANYKFDGFDVTSVTSHWNRHASTTQDGTEPLTAYLNVAGIPVPSYNVADGGIGPISWTELDKTAQFSEELRVASTGDSRFQWLGGLFYSGFASTFIQTSGNVPGAIPYFGISNLLYEDQPSTIDQKAVFGELSFKVVDGLKVTAGGRYFEYNSKIPDYSYGVFAGGTDALVYQFAQAKDHGFNPKVNISYDVDKDLMVYATAERGFRPGNGDFVPALGSPLGDACAATFMQNPPPNSYQPDTVWSYELGEKYKIGSTLTLNGALYHERWENVQQTVSLQCGDQYTANAGTAVVNGGELEAKWFLTSNWLVSANYGYSHAYFVETVAGTGIAVGSGVQDIPLETASGALTYFFPIRAGWQASVRGSYDWTDGLVEPPIVVPSGKLPAHGFANLRATVFNDRWTVAAFVNNLTNKHAELEGASVVVAPIPSLTRYVTNQPLTAGIDVNVKF